MTGQELVRATELPGGLTHGPSRRFLTEEGLPESGAHLDFLELAAGRLEQPATADGGVVPGAEQLFVLGETEYCGSPVVLDGVSGRVLLAEWAGGRLTHDLLASDLSALAALIRETEESAQAARRPGLPGGSHGAAAADTAAAAAERRMRELDPGLFARGRDGFAAATPPAHWGVAVLIASLRWGARPGVGPEGPAYEFAADLVEELAALNGEGEVRRWQPEELPEALVHGPTRSLLTGAGLPLGGSMFAVHDTPLVTMAQAHPDWYGADADPQERDLGGHLAVGWWPHDLEIALDGATGRLELPDWYDDGEPEAYLNRDLSALLYTLWTYERLRAEWRRWDYGRGRDAWAVFDPHALLGHVVDGLVEAIDPEAFSTPLHSWRSLAEDGHTGGLLG